jgi:hypothetical protein
LVTRGRRLSSPRSSKTRGKDEFAKSSNIAERLTRPMCDCEELEFEDFEVMLASISKMSAAPESQAPLEVPVIQAVSKRKR